MSLCNVRERLGGFCAITIKRLRNFARKYWPVAVRLRSPARPPTVDDFKSNVDLVRPPVGQPNGRRKAATALNVDQFCN
jgi:hypothetical protein